MTALMMGCLPALPCFILIFYCRNFDCLEDEEFIEKWGAVYEGLEYMRASLFANVIFVLRRMLFAYTCIKLSDSLWLQISMSMVVTTLAASYHVHYKPYEELLLDRLEIFNEVTIILLFSFVYCFTSLTRQETHDTIGIFFMTIIAGNISVHLYFIFSNIIRDTYL
jgi:hypothetical protein